MTQILQATPEAIRRVAAAVRAGELVAFPTETVYGLGADACNDRAVAAVFAAKGRPQFNPLIVHVASASQTERLVVCDARVQALAAAFWPGPLTLVLPRRADSGLSLLVSAGLDTVAVRVPAHPVAQALLEAAGCPIAAPSANRSGAISPTAPAHVAESLGSSVGWILAAGRAAIGIESTVLDLSAAVPALLRPGAITREQLQAVLGETLQYHDHGMISVREESHSGVGLRAPGQLASHYAPNCPVRLNCYSADSDEALLTFGPDAFVRGGRTRLNLSPGGDLHEAAANLFAMLRALDTAAHQAIAVMPIPEEGLGVAINDRLRRAAAPRPLPANDPHIPL